mgnify:CR=1 FL=1
MTVKRGDIYYADLSPVVGSEQGGVRPVLIIQNDVGNKYSPTVICAAITSKLNKAKTPCKSVMSLTDSFQIGKEQQETDHQLRWSVFMDFWHR